MNFFRGLFWTSILSLLIWIVILSCSYSIVHEVDYRRELVTHKAQYYKWWHERDLNTHVTQKEWTR
jgi:cell division protein FtsL